MPAPATLRHLAVACGAALVVAGCGSRLPEADLAAAAGPPPEADGAVPDAPPGDATFGSLAVPCGPGDGPPAEPTAQVPGVSRDVLRIAVISDRAGAVKVPTASIEESMEAFVDWCNGFGGINGRTLELEAIDSKLFSHLEATQEACEAEVFAIVGSGSVADNQGAQAMVDCGLVEVPAYAATPAKALSDNMVQPLPNPSDRYHIGAARYVADTEASAVEHAALIYPGVDTAVLQAQRTKDAYEQAGYTFTYEQETGAIEETYAPEALAMQRAGVEWVTMVSAPTEAVKLLRDMATQGFDPTVIELGAQYYGAELLAEPAAEGAIVQLGIVPFEEADHSPALATYLERYAATAGDDAPEPTALGVNAFSAGLLFATAASALDDDLTRTGLLEELRAIRDWDGGGLHAPADPGGRGVSPCFALVQVSNGRFERLHPPEPATFDCDPSDVIELRGDVGDGATVSGS